MNTQHMKPGSPAFTAATLTEGLSSTGYIADEEAGLSLWLALELGRPLLIEGPAGVGKTEIARAAASCLDRELVRLSCYEGLDEAKALYEWDYAKQMLYTQLVREVIARETSAAADVKQALELAAASGAAFFDRRFLVPRPLLRALESEQPAVLLIDEVDRADPEFEAFLLELLADMAVTIPELGLIRAKHTPLCVLTTNGTREMTDALRRRCLHLFMDYPSPQRELAILRRRLPGLDQQLAESVVRLVARVRQLDLKKAPSIGETIDWTQALLRLGKSSLDPRLCEDTLGLLLKHQEDRALAAERLPELLGPG